MHPEDGFEFCPLPGDEFDAGQFLAGLVAGAAIGAGLALLFAPRTGEESRHEIAEAYSVLADKASDAVETVRDRVTDTVESVRVRATDVVDTAKDAVEDWLARSKQTVEAARERLDTAVEAGRDAYESRKTELNAQVEATLED